MSSSAGAPPPEGATDYYKSQDLSRLPPAALEERAALLQSIGESDEGNGKYNETAYQFEEAARTTSLLLKAEPDDYDRIYAHAQSEFWVGQLAWELDNYAKVEPYFRAYLDLARRLVQLRPGQAKALTERAYAQNSLGSFVLRHGKDYPGAEKYYAAGLADFEAVRTQHPDDAELASQIADTWGWATRSGWPEIVTGRWRRVSTRD